MDAENSISDQMNWILLFRLNLQVSNRRRDTALFFQRKTVDGRNYGIQ